jgi:putative ABC transport system permease protein
MGFGLKGLLRLARRFLPPEVRDEIVGDWVQEHRERRNRGESALRAGARLIWEVVSTEYVALGRAARRLRRRPAEAGSGIELRPPHTERSARREVGTMQEAWRWRFEVWHAIRVLWRARGFASLAVVTVAIGVGSVAAVAGVASSILLRPLPYQDADDLVMVWQADREEGDLRINASEPLFWRWRERVASFSAIAAYRGPGWTMVTDGPEPERVPSLRVTPNFFPLLGVEPELGRGFTAGDAAPSGGGNVIVSASLWERLGWSDERIGSQVSLDEQPFVIVGVMPPGFSFIERGVDIWYAYEPRRAETWDQWTLRVVARLAPKVSRDAAGAEVSGLHEALRSAQPELDVPPETVVRSVLDELVAGVRPGLAATIGAVLIGLLIAMVNVGGLLLARNLTRRPEFAMMRALGASRLSVIRHVAWQSVALSTAGLVLGLGFARALVAAATNWLPAHFPRAEGVSVDAFALRAAVGATLLVAIGAGLLSLPWAESGIRAAVRPRGRGRALGAVLVGQTALAVILLLSGGLLVRSFVGLASLDPGIDPDSVVVLDLRLPSSLVDDAEATRQFVQRIDGAVSALPGVSRAGQIQRLPFAGGNWNSFVIDPEAPAPERLPESDVRVITPGYLSAVGLPLRRGRGFDERDGADAPRVVLVNEVLASELWPGSNPLGRRLVVDMFGSSEAEVVGVVGPVRHHGLDVMPQPEVYVPYAQAPVGFSTLVVRGTIDDEMVSAVRRTVRETRATATVSRAAMMTELVHESIATQRMHAFVFGALALLALALAGVGIFSVASFRVTHERHEIGLRAALGASSGQLQRSVLLRTGRELLLGLTLGFIASFAVLRGLSALLYGLAPDDPATYGLVAAVLVVLGLAASLLPARRAASVDPMIAIREVR